MKFIADLHIHSKFSRATSKQSDLEHLYIAAQCKGVTVVGTGDAVHPGWLSEIREKLTPAEPGLYRLKRELAAVCDTEVPEACRGEVRFLLQTEISNIYKKAGRTRKNHNIVFLPSIEKAYQLSDRLEGIGNIRSDGRPILGLDAKHLLDIVLEVSDRAFLIPAHIWTPWFSLFGAKSGFDAIEECFEDLTGHIFALETGLSSDPAMNWQVSDLDDYLLVSNSDAHSPGNLGREANIFETALSFDAIRAAMEQKDHRSFLGTIEFYPEEGKYHLDGHRKCGVCLRPEEARRLGGQCPVCKKPLTLGVRNRVSALADRVEGEKPENAMPYNRLVPLAAVLAEIFRVGPASKKVQRAHLGLLRSFGSELFLLKDLPLDTLETSGVPLLATAVDRMRKGRMCLLPGYDGKYGQVRIFDDGERETLLGQQALFGEKKDAADAVITAGSGNIQGKVMLGEPAATETKAVAFSDRFGEAFLSRLNASQQTAVIAPPGPLLIVAGPGTGKTRTLTCRIAHMIGVEKTDPRRILAVTFTTKAAEEMRQRLEEMLGTTTMVPPALTFHALCLRLLAEKDGNRPMFVIDEGDRQGLIRHVIRTVVSDGHVLSPNSFLQAIVSAKQQLKGPDAVRDVDNSPGKIVSAVYGQYQAALEAQRLLDYEDILMRAVWEMEHDEQWRRQLVRRYQHLFIDEYQDLNYAQYRLVRLLAPPTHHVCVIGDPDQSIYGFRGADHRHFIRFMEDYPAARLVHLDRNYRSTRNILDAAYQMIGKHRVTIPGAGAVHPRVTSAGNKGARLHLLECPNEQAEAAVVARTIEKLVGGVGYHAIDTGRVASGMVQENIGFSDIAVLYRTGDQHRPLSAQLEKAGIPFQVARQTEAEGMVECRQLLSLYKVIAGCGHYADFERITGVWRPGLGKETVRRFCRWGIHLGLDLERAGHHAGRFPIAEMQRLQQEKLVDFFKILSGFARQITGKSFEEALVYLLERTCLGRTQAPGKGPSAVSEQILKIAANVKSPEHFFAQQALATEVDAVSLDAQKVTLMTLHAAKGLEFSVVFIAGCEDGLVPYFRDGTTMADPQEERRLFFVGMTRAKSRLFMSWSRTRRVFAERRRRLPSPFLAEIAKDLVRREEPMAGVDRTRTQTQLKMF